MRKSALLFFIGMVLLCVFLFLGLVIQQESVPSAGFVGNPPKSASSPQSLASLQSAVQEDLGVEKSTSEVTIARVSNSISEGRRVQDSTFSRLLVLDSRGSPLNGFYSITKCTSQLASLLMSDLGANREHIEFLGETTASFFKDGILDFSGFEPRMEYFVWVQVDGFFIKHGFLRLPLQEGKSEWRLQESKALSVDVVDEEGSPIQGVPVHVFNSVADSGYLGLEWRDRLPQKFFLWIDRTDVDGRVVLSSPLAEGMSISASAPSGLRISSNLEAYAGEEVVLVASASLSVHGRVVDQDGRPIPRGYVSFLTQGDQGTKDAGIAVIGEDGNYATTSVSAKASLLLAIATAEGYAPQRACILRPVAGEIRQVDFQLAAAVPVMLQIVDAKGFPMPSIEVMVSTDGYDWVPGSYVTDLSGEIRTAVNLIPGQTYLLEWWSSWWKGKPLPFTVPRSLSDPIVLRAMNMGRLRRRGSSLVDEVSTDASYYPKGLWKNHRIDWDLDNEVSPFLPSGPGVLVIRNLNGTRTEVQVVVPDGGVESVDLVSTLATLRFFLPLSSESQWALRFSGSSGSRTKRRQFPEGANELQLPIGRYSLVIETGSLRGYSVGPFELTEKGLDLGEIQIGGGSIQGVVSDEEGIPWPDMRVELNRDDNWFGGQTKTSSAGSFSFVDLAPGEYRVQVLPNTSHLLFQPDQIATVRLGSAETVKGVDFVVPSGEAVVCRLPDSVTHPVQGFHARDGWLEISPVDGENRFLISAPSLGDWIGGFSLMYGRAFFLSDPVGSQDAQYLVGVPSADSKEIRLVDLSGNPLASAFIEFRLNGRVMFPGGASADSGGYFSCSASTGLPIDLLIHLPGGGVSVIPFSSLPGGGDFVVGGGFVPMVVYCHTLAGVPIPGVTIWNPRTRTRGVTAADGTGTVQGTPDVDLIRLEKEGFWPVKLEVRESTDVPLRRTLPLVTLVIPEGLPIADLAVEPLFSLGYPVVTAPVSGDSSNSWVLRGIPEGLYLAQGLDREGQVLLSREIRLTAESSAVIRIR